MGWEEVWWEEGWEEAPMPMHRIRFSMFPRVGGLGVGRAFVVTSEEKVVGVVGEVVIPGDVWS